MDDDDPVVWSPQQEMAPTPYLRRARQSSQARSRSPHSSDSSFLADDPEAVDKEDTFGRRFGRRDMAGAWVGSVARRSTSRSSAGNDLNDAFANVFDDDEEDEDEEGEEVVGQGRGRATPASARASSPETTSSTYAMDRLGRDLQASGDEDYDEQSEADDLLGGVFSLRQQKPKNAEKTKKSKKSGERESQQANLGGIKRMRSGASRKKEAGMASAKKGKDTDAKSHEKGKGKSGGTQAKKKAVKKSTSTGVLAILTQGAQDREASLDTDTLSLEAIPTRGRKNTRSKRVISPPATPEPEHEDGGIDDVDGFTSDAGRRKQGFVDADEDEDVDGDEDMNAARTQVCRTRGHSVFARRLTEI